jgi:hypothetical protein
MSDFSGRGDNKISLNILLTSMFQSYIHNFTVELWLTRHSDVECGERGLTCDLRRGKEKGIRVVQDELELSCYSLVQLPRGSQLLQ